MYLLLTLPLDEPDTAKAFRLLVKKRVHGFNKETLDQLEPKERLDKLQETFEAVVAGHQRIADKFAAV